jgi:glutamyl-tRNA reductase
MNIHCLGINHRTAPIEIREKLWFSNGELPSLLAALHAGEQMAECALVSTCNRTELYYVPAPGSPNGAPLWRTLAAKKGTADAFRDEHFYSYSGLDAVRHLYRVVSGIDSMVLGDVQIISQVKEAFQAAQEHHTTGILLNRLYNNALHVGKRSRTETEIGEGAVSVSYAAAELASKIFSDLSKRTAMLVGAGETGKLTAKHLQGRNLGKMVFANRTRAHAERLAEVLGGGSVVDYERMASEVPNVDILISSVNSPSHVLTAAEIRQAMKSRGNRPLFIIDIGVPRNIDPAANTIDNVFLHDIDGLNQIIDGNLAHRRAEVPKVESIIDEEATVFEHWFQSLDVSPTIQQLREAFEQIRSEEVGKHANHFDRDTADAVELLTKRIVNKILHTPMSNLRNGTGEPGADETRTKIYFIRHLFGLDKRTHHDND